MRQIELVDAYIVRSQPWRESSLLYRMVTRNYGWISVLHRGARGARKNNGALPSLTPVRVSWGGRGSLQTLRQSEIAGPAIIQDGTRKIYALYVNEVISYLLPQDRRSEEIYPIYHQALEELRAAADPECALRGIELDLLDLSGHSLRLEQTASGPVEAESWYRYDLDEGPVKVLEGAESEEMRDIVIRGATLLALQRRNGFEGDVRLEARRLMRRLVDHHVAPHVIHTRNIMRSMK